MGIFKSFVLVAFLLCTMSIAVSAQSTAEQLRLGSSQEASKKPDLKEKLFIPVSPTTIGAGTYAFSSTTASLDDMSSGTTQLVAANLDDNASAVSNIGFEFFYDGVRFTQFSCNANGLCRLGGTAVSTAFDNSTGFVTTTNAPKIAPYFDDMWTGTNGKIHFKVTGSAPNRKLVVEWLNEQIPRVGTGTAGAGTFQMWLFETSGVIQFVYGTGVGTNTTNGGYTIGLQSGASTNFASITNTGATISYTTANNTQTDAITSGTSFVLTPNTPAAPSGLNFTAITPVGMTLNWADNATNELGYAVYRSTDGINFTFLNTTAANAVSFTDAGLSPSTSYTYRVVAFSEGGVSATLSGTQSTLAPGNISTATNGNWSNPATWVGGVVPTAGDNVTIATGASVVLDTNAAALSLTIGSAPSFADKDSDTKLSPQGITGTLTFDPAVAHTLAVGGDVFVKSDGVLQGPPTGTITTNVLSVGGNLTNNGTLDLSTNGNTAGANLTFASGTSTVTFGGTGATTDVRTITVNKGAQASTVELKPNTFTVQGVSTDVAGYLTVTSGTFKISGTFAMTNRTFATATYVVPLTGGIWLNNPSYTVTAQAGGTTCANNGLFRMTQGTYNIGVTGADGMGGGTGATFIIEGGTISATRIDPQNAVTWTQTAGTINVGTVANTRSNFGTFELFSTAAAFTMSGGTFNLIQAAVAATPVDFRVNALSNITGGVVNAGTAATTTNFNFRISGFTPSIVVDNTTNNKTATFITATAGVNNLVFGNLTVNTGATANLNGTLVALAGTTLTNNGTLTGTTANSRLYFLGTGAPQTYTGTGTVTAGLASFDVDNVLGVTIDPGVSQIVVLRMILFSGDLHNTGKLTLGNGGTTSGIVQIGNTTTPTAAGGYDAPPVFNLGTGGQLVSYLRTTSARTTGVEINPARQLVNLTYDDNNGLHQLSVAGGDLTVSGVLTLTNGVINTGSYQLTHNGTVTRTLGYVNGKLNRTYTATGAYTYHVGQNGYSPVLATVTALGINPSSLMFSATDSTFTGMDPAHSVSRNWNSNEVGDITATLAFTYLASDVNGTEADYRVYDQTVNLCSGAPCVDTVGHVATTAVPAINFGRFTVGELQTPTVVTTGSITGRTTTSNGNGIRNILVTLSGGDLAQPISTVTSGFGYYSFGGLTDGQTYTVTITPKKYVFPTTSRLVTVSANEVFVDFISNP